MTSADTPDNVAELPSAPAPAPESPEPAPPAPEPSTPPPDASQAEERPLEVLAADTELSSASVEELSAHVKKQSATLGPTHPDTLAARTVLADRLAAAGFLNWALYEAQTLVDDLVRTHGVDHPDVEAARARVEDFRMRKHGLP